MSQLGAPIIRPPLPGENFIEVTQAEPNAHIFVYGSDGEIGDGGGSPIILTRVLVAGETIDVVQQVGPCISTWVYRVRVECPAGDDGKECGTGDWPAFRQNPLRNAQQTQASVLASPAAVKRLRVRWQFRPSGGVGFRASPIVHNGRVFIGNGNGRLYALDANSGALLWQYPAAAQPALTTQFSSNPSSFGIASSAAIGRAREGDVVIFGAPDQSIGAGLGSGRLFALNPATGAEVWKSPEIAVLDGLNRGSVNERHEQIGYSSPLVFGDRVYIGIADHGDNPIQNGRVVAVDRNSGALVAGFNFVSTGNRGGGVWSSVAGGLAGGGVYATTGNSNSGCSGCGTEPKPNHGLSMLRLDAGNGALAWKLQPVPFALDRDPDWASGPALVDASCGPTVVSTMKDGWAYAASVTAPNAPNASVRWQFPSTGFPFAPGDGTVHAETRYLIPGAVWQQVFLDDLRRRGHDHCARRGVPAHPRAQCLRRPARSLDCRHSWVVSDRLSARPAVGYARHRLRRHDTGPSRCDCGSQCLRDGDVPLQQPAGGTGRLHHERLPLHSSAEDPPRPGPQSGHRGRSHRRRACAGERARLCRDQ